MADHLDAPGLMSPGMDARVDITDVYAFEKLKNRKRSILVMNVNPLGPTLATAFNTDAIYQINVDTDGDARTKSRSGSASPTPHRFGLQSSHQENSFRE